MRLFDEVLSGRLYKKLKIQGEDATGKIIELPEVAPAAERDFERVLSSVDDVADIRRFQQDFMRALQDPAFNAVIRPFLPAELLEHDFRALARRLADCGDLTGPESLARVHAARRSLSEFTTVAANHDSAYSERFLVALGERISAALDRLVADSPLSKPASIALAATDKRYPLHREGAELLLSLRLVNQGAGPAYDVTVTFDDASEVVALESLHLIGDVPADGQSIAVRALVLNTCSASNVSYLVEWRNADGRSDSHLGDLTIPAQRPDVDWDRFDALNPYPNKAVADDMRLAGRKTMLQELEALVTGPEVGSTRISGQKRVGKSSIVRSLQARLKRLPGLPLLVAYVDVNKLGTSDDAEAALSVLMRQISRTLVNTRGTLTDVRIPDYSDGLEEFAGFLDDVQLQEPDKSILVMLDEFDEMPNGLFERGGPGDAFFRALKSLSSEGECGFVLVGGERLELALSRQGDRLNAFLEFHVDYLGEDSFDDFRELVQKPVTGFLDYDERALRELYSHTGGHPFFTFVVCREVVANARANRDAHVTTEEVNAAYSAALQSAPASFFAHTWFDHIFDDHAAVSVIADRRIRVLLAWAACLRNRRAPTSIHVCQAALEYDVEPSSVNEELRSFVNRKILRRVDDEYRATSRFFEDWLREWGSERIRAEHPEMGSLARYAAREDDQRIRAHELTELTRKWPVYRSAPISAEDVRQWVEQFGDVQQQRLALTILQGINFFPTRRIKELFTDLHRRARHGVVIDLDERARRAQRKSRDFVVAYVEGDGKSAQLMAQAYADANRIARECVAQIDRVPDVITRHKAQRVIIVDDFIGTGATLAKRLGDYSARIAEAARLTGTTVMLAVACGFEGGIVSVEQAVERLSLPIEVLVGEELDQGDQCFADSSAVFDSDEERLVARRMVEEFGRDLGSTEPLGTGSSEALVVFEHNCPNNSLPILWKHGNAVPWTPLFPRVTT
jgi:hypothetical protein